MANCINSDIFKRASTIVKHFCTRKGEKFSEALAIYMMKILSIHPKYDAAEKDDEILVKSLSEDCVKMHIEKDNPAVLLVVMKVYFDLNYRRSEQFHKENRKNCKRKCNPVLQKILVAAPNFLCHEVVLRDIITFLLLYASDKINSVNLTAMKNIVLTVLPISEIPTFLAFSQKERKDYMMELAPVAAGIKVNTIWSTEQGQRAINKVITKLVDTVSKLFLMSQTEFSKVQALINHLQGVLKYYLLTEDPKIEEPFSFDLTYLRSLLAFLNMYSFFYCILMEDCQALAVRSFQLEQAFRQALDDLVATLSTEVVIPSTVFSYYKEVGTLWKFIKDEMLYFKSMVTVFKQLSSFKNNAERNLDKKKIVQLLEKVGEKVDLDMKPSDKNQVKAMELSHRNKLVETGDLHSSGKEDNIQILSSDSIKNTDEVSLEFEGFCPWALVHGEGSLLPANRKLGLVMYQSRCYGFCSADGRNAFLENPDSLLNAVWDFIRVQGYFIIIFKLQDNFGINMQVEDMLDSHFVPPILISSTGCQTDLHPVEKRIDEGYTWNQWWWRKRALKYVDIKTKGTHSTQTDLSHFRRENYSQVYLPKENWSQTRKDGSTTMPKAGIPELKHPVRKGIL